MGTWMGWLVPAAIAVLLGLGVSYYLRRIRLPRDESAAGIASLADLRWREFVNLVLEALSRRGFERDADSGTGTDEHILLLRDGERWILSSRQWGSHAVGAHELSEFANDMRLKGAIGGMLATTGTFPPELERHAQMHRVQLLDGPALWPELQALLPAGQREAALAATRARLRQQVLMAWAGAALVGLLLFWTLDRGDSSPMTMPAATVRAAPGAIAAKAAPAPPENAAADELPAPTDPAQLAQRRAEVIKLASTLPQVDRAVWSTQSTLLVYLLDGQVNPMADLCPILEHYEELRASRVQLQPPQGSDRPVRFLQCRAF